LGTKSAEHSINSVLASKQQAEAAGLPQEESMEGDTEEDPHKSNLVLLRVQPMLIPLLLKEEFLNKDLWASDIGSAAVGAALHSIVMELKQHRDDYLASGCWTKGGRSDIGRIWGAGAGAGAKVWLAKKEGHRMKMEFLVLVILLSIQYPKNCEIYFTAVRCCLLTQNDKLDPPPRRFRGALVIGERLGLRSNFHNLESHLVCVQPV
jgi:hypothetical protein